MDVSPALGRGAEGTLALDSFPVEPGSPGGGSFDADERLIAEIEREIGPEAAEATRRSRQLARNPQALTSAERVVLPAAIEPILRDLRSSGAIVPEVVEEAQDDAGPDRVAAWIQPPGSADSQGVGSSLRLGHCRRTSRGFRPDLILPE